MTIAPRSFGENLNEWFRTLGRNWKPLLLTALAVHVPLGLIVFSVLLVTGGDAFEILFDIDNLESMPWQEIWHHVVPFVWTIGIWVILQTIAGVFVYLAGARIVATDFAGETASTGAASRFAVGRTPRALAAAVIVLIGATVLTAIPVAIGWALIAGTGTEFVTVFIVSAVSLTALVLLIWLGVALSMFVQVVAMEPTSPWHALTRSFALVSGRWWQTLGFLLVTSIIISAASQILSLLLTPIYVGASVFPMLFALALAATAVIQGPVLAATSAAYAIWYVDLRARRETLEAEALL